MIAANDRLTLQIPNDLDYVDIVMDATEAFAAKVGFDRRDASRIRLAVEEGVCNIIEHAFEPDEKASFTVTLIPTGFGLRIELHDEGLPYAPPDDAEKGDIAKSVGTKLMRGMMDELAFVNLGQHGKTLVMEKYLKAGSVAEDVSASEVEYYQTAAAPEKAERISRTVTQVQPDNRIEAVEIAQCAYKTYGYGYANTDIYYPERLMSRLRDGTMISFIARNDLNGDMMGHCAICTITPDDKVAENAVAFVKPQYRGQAVLGDLSAERLEKARKLGLWALFSHTVAAHPASQKNSIKSGFVESGFVLCMAPAMDWKGFNLGEQTIRTSIMNVILYLVPFPEVTLYPPKNHAEILGEIYARHKRAIIFVDAPSDVPDEKRSRIESSVYSSMNYGCIDFLSIGQDAVGALNGQIRQLAREGAVHMDLYLPLQSSFTPALCAEAEKIGFYFSGVTLGTDGRDILMLQLNNCDVDYSLVSTPTEFGRRLLEYIKSEDPTERTGGGQ